MPPVFAQSMVEYTGVSGSSAVRAIDVLGEQMDSVFYALNNSISDHPMMWAAGVVLVGWLLLRPRR